MKAHTIRVWERRYGLLEPARTDTNIRTYGVAELKTILNVAFLNRHGVKISHIAGLSAKEREHKVKQLASNGSDPGGHLNALKLAMVGYDTALFNTTSEQYSEEHGFRALVEQLYVPLLEHIGVLWQSNAICPAQEHFVSNLVRQRLVVAIDHVRTPVVDDGALYVLYLPENEIHELGLLYVHYLLRAGGQRVVYLGQSVPAEDLVQVAAQFTGAIVFIAVCTAFPRADDMGAYMERLRFSMPDERITFRFSGSRVAVVEGLQEKPGMQLFPKFSGLLTSLE